MKQYKYFQVGNGQIKPDIFGEIRFNETDDQKNMISDGNLIEEVFAKYIEDGNVDEYMKRIILAPFNSTVDRINNTITKE